jgi:putative intracellular protease/amidase
MESLNMRSDDRRIWVNQEDQMGKAHSGLMLTRASKPLTLVWAAAVISLFAAPADATEIAKKRILLVASSVNSMVLKNGRAIPTGYFLNELSVPVQAFIEAGYEVVVATPDGNAPAVDPVSLTPALFGGDAAALTRAMEFVLSNPSIQKPAKLDALTKELGSFVAVYVPGGRAPMIDLMEDQALGKALAYFHKNRITTAMLCHAPIAFASALKDPKAFRRAMADRNTGKAKEIAADWPYAGYKMTLLSTEEEIPKERALGGKMPFYIEDVIRLAGAVVQVGPPGKPFIVIDREVITGQNPASDQALSDAVLKALKAKSGE